MNPHSNNKLTKQLLASKLFSQIKFLDICTNDVANECKRQKQAVT